MTRHLGTVAMITLAAGGAAILTSCEQSSSPDQVSAPATETEQASPTERYVPAAGETGVAPPTDQATPTTDAMPAALSATRVYAGDLSFAVPEGWESRPPSNRMRAAEVAAPGIGDSPGPVTAFSLAGGSIDANIDRWAGQFADPDATRSRETREIGGRTVHLVEMAGSFRGMGGPLQEGTTMLAAIVEQPGQPSVFVKLTGPSAAVDAAKPAWNAMIESLSSP